MSTDLEQTIKHNDDMFELNAPQSVKPLEVKPNTSKRLAQAVSDTTPEIESEKKSEVI